jgi:N-methylhydantoinase B
MLGISAHVTLKPGEWIVSHTAGGGGFGSPLERDPERARQDVIEGWIGRQRAVEVYGVVLNDDLKVDPAGTTLRRREIRKASAAAGKRI